MFLKEILRFIFGLIVFGGLFGNATNLFIFSKKNMWQSFTFKLIFYLSSIDLIIFILCAVESFIWFEFEINIRILSSILCKIDIFLAHYLLHARTIISLAILINSKKIFFNSFLVVSRTLSELKPH